MLEDQETPSAVPQNVCRLCGEFKEDLISIFSETGNKLRLRKKINTLLKINVIMSDKLPSHVCQPCVTQLNLCHSMVNFFDQTQSNLKLLQKIHKPSNTENPKNRIGDIILQNHIEQDQSEIKDVVLSGNGILETDPLEQETTETTLGSINQEEIKMRQSRTEDTVTEATNGLLTSDSNTPQNTKDDCTLLDKESLYFIHGVNVKLPIACDFCPETFEDLNCFDAHMVTHKECRFFSCQLCSNTYVSWGNLVAHRKACHRSEVLSCEECGKRKYHPDLGPVNYPVGEYPVGCEECHQGFQTLNQLYRHYKANLSHRNSDDIKDFNHKTEEQQGKDNNDSPVELGKKRFEAVSFSYVCPVCNKQFITSEQLSAHMAMLADDNICYTCSVCNAKFCNAGALVDHKRSHPSAVLKSRKCSVCSKVLRNRATYFRHMLIHSKEKPYVCDWCPKAFNRKTALEYHKYTHPLKEYYKCYNCATSYVDYLELENHVKTCHTQVKENEKLICDICGQHFVTEQFLPHYKICHLLKEEQNALKRRANVTCPICQKVFSQPTALNRHLKLHNPAHRQLHTCEVCGKTILQRHQILAHARMHYGDDDTKLPEKYRKMKHSVDQGKKYRQTASQRSFFCEYCGREFNKKINLHLHVRRHTGDKPYTCQLCGKAFYTNQQLAIHVRQHTGERPYVCNVCQKTFTSPTALYVHRKIHDKKQYICPHCGKQFLWKNGFIGHVRLHTGERPYHCKICPKTFTLVSKLNLHVKKHAEEKQEQICDTCGKTFPSYEDLASHQVFKCSADGSIDVKQESETVVLKTEDLHQNQEMPFLLMTVVQ